MSSPASSAIRMIAPCGINCSVCRAFLRNKNKCNGCWGPDGKKPNHCRVCSIKNCDQLSITNSKFCYDCASYPCARIKQLDKRYQLKYKTSISDNQRLIKDLGLDRFVADEIIKWKCTDCGGIICIHTGYCINCGQSKIY